MFCRLLLCSLGVVYAMVEVCRRLFSACDRQAYYAMVGV